MLGKRVVALTGNPLAPLGGMPNKNEPQSYGSQAEWTTGDTGQSVNRQKSPPTAEHADFYESRIEKETTGPDEGGSVSPVQFADVEGARVVQHGVDDVPARRVTGVRSGAKREGFFKKRDY